MFGKDRGFHVAAVAWALAGGLGLAACDERPQQGDRQQRSERTVGEKPPPDTSPQRTEKADPGPPARVNPGARPQTPAAANLVGTWRVRVETPAGGPEGVTYTFTADGRVTVGPGQDCRYRLENQELAIDCAGTTAESAKGRLERQDENVLVWKVGDKEVRLERQAGVKEQP